MGDSIDWGDAANAAINVGAGYLGNKAASSASDDYQQDAIGLASLQNDWNRENQTWAMDENARIANENQERNIAGGMLNRPQQNSDFGSVNWSTDENGMPVQTTSIAPELQSSLAQLRGGYSDMLGGLESGFGVDNDVMAAIRGLQQPGLQQNEDAQRARYAAMGIPMQSRAYDDGEQNLARTRTDADLQAILGGQDAWNNAQANTRSNLGTMSNLETGWNNNANAMPGFNQIAVAQQGPIGSVTAPGLGNVMSGASSSGQSAGASWANMGEGLGNLANSAYESYYS